MATSACADGGVLVWPAVIRSAVNVIALQERLGQMWERSAEYMCLCFIVCWWLP